MAACCAAARRLALRVDNRQWQDNPYARYHLPATEYIRADLATPAQVRVKSTERAKFPILGQRGATVDWQLVADHGQQAQHNHGQSVTQLANRGGLSWRELHAVLHNERWKKIDQNEAILACRALEARYLAAIEPQPDPRDEVIARLVEALELSANRLQRCAVDYDTGSHEFMETSEWAEEARAALAAAKAVHQ